jgi:enterochelin esterase-like enzyme
MKIKTHFFFARSVRLSAVVASLLFSLAMSTAAASPVRFKVTLDPSAATTEHISGRLLIFMTKSEKQLEMISPDFADPNAVFISGTEVANLTAGKSIEIDADALSFPVKFSDAPAGEYQIMALLDRDHSYTYNGPGPGDIRSKIIKAAMPADGVELVLSQTAPERKIDLPANARLVEFESPMLSAFWGRPIKMLASVILPPSYDKSATLKYPTVYNVTGYGGTRFSRFRRASAMAKDMADGKRPEMINVYLEAQVPLGHSVWADSANNGPWGTALEKEFIPYLEKQFRMEAKPSGRFLTGHSSGGWSTLWVMVSHPDFFGGTWSTSPDPVDFRSFTGPDLTKYPPQNAYTDASGKDYNLVRDKGKELMTVRQYAQQEYVTGYYGGQFGSFNAVFSPKGDDGQPMKLFDIKTGRIDPLVAKAWEKYDISRILRTNWKTLGPKLKGKLHIYVGTADTFHLDEAVRLLDAELKKFGSDAKIEYIDGRTHFDLYQIGDDQEGLLTKIQWEMYAIARPKAKAAAK